MVSLILRPGESAGQSEPRIEEIRYAGIGTNDYLAGIVGLKIGNYARKS